MSINKQVSGEWRWFIWEYKSKRKDSKNRERYKRCIYENIE
jgi:hypothetical protein